MYFLHYARTAGTLDRLLDSGEDGGQGIKLEGGTQQICTMLAQVCLSFVVPLLELWVEANGVC